MGIFSKLFGKAAEDAAADMFGDEKHYFDNLRQDYEPVQPVRPAPSSKNNPASAPRGNCPWGDIMPAEENQYSFSGSYVEYFNKVFSEEFPSYQISYAPAENGRAATIFTFTNAGRTALIVELMSDRSSVRKLRNQCWNEGIPYLRFYYDHPGWWNARSYVAGRVRSALSV